MSKNYGVIWVGGELNVISFKLMCQGCVPLDQAARDPIWPDLEHFHGWGICSFSGQLVPVHHRSLSKGFFPLISNLNLLLLIFFNCKTGLLVLSFQSQIESFPVSSAGLSEVSLKLSLLQAEQVQLPQPFFIGVPAL